MKHQGSKIQHNDVRDKELRRLFSKYFNEGLNPGDIRFYQQIVKTPASRFWVSEDRAAEVISKMLRGEDIGNMYKEKQRMYREILRRTEEKLATEGARPIYHVVFEVVNSPAPEFYMSPATANKIISNMRRAR